MAGVVCECILLLLIRLVIYLPLLIYSVVFFHILYFLIPFTVMSYSGLYFATVLWVYNFHGRYRLYRMKIFMLEGQDIYFSSFILH